MRIARPFIAFYNWCANITLRAMGVQVKDELEITVSTVELSEMIAESLVGGAARPRGAPAANPRATDPRPGRRRCCGAAGRDSRGAGRGRRQRTDRPRHPARARRDRLFTIPRQRPVRSVHRIPTHQRCAARSSITLTPSSTDPRCAHCHRCVTPYRCPMRSHGYAAAQHRALVTNARWLVAMVAPDDLVEDLVGAVRDGTHRV